MTENFMLYGWMIVAFIVFLLTCFGIWLNYYLGDEDWDD